MRVIKNIGGALPGGHYAADGNRILADVVGSALGLGLR